MPGRVVLEPPLEVLEEQPGDAAGLDLLVDGAALVGDHPAGQQRRLALDREGAAGLVDVGGLAHQAGRLVDLRLAAAGHDHDLDPGPVAGLQPARLGQREAPLGVAEERAAPAEQGAVEVGVDATQCHTGLTLLIVTAPIAIACVRRSRVLARCSALVLPSRPSSPRGRVPAEPASATSMALQPDGKIVIAGRDWLPFATWRGSNRTAPWIRALVRTASSLDRRLQILRSLAIEPGGDIVGAGVEGFQLARYLGSNGAPDPAFGGGLAAGTRDPEQPNFLYQDYGPSSVVPDPGGGIVVGGTRSSAGPKRRPPSSAGTPPMGPSSKPSAAFPSRKGPRASNRISSLCFPSPTVVDRGGWVHQGFQERGDSILLARFRTGLRDELRPVVRRRGLGHRETARPHRSRTRGPRSMMPLRTAAGSSSPARRTGPSCSPASTRTAPSTRPSAKAGSRSRRSTGSAGRSTSAPSSTREAGPTRSRGRPPVGSSPSVGRRAGADGSPAAGTWRPRAENARSRCSSASAPTASSTPTSARAGCCA